MKCVWKSQNDKYFETEEVPTCSIGQWLMLIWFEKSTID
jgi:hypothetical protein